MIRTIGAVAALMLAGWAIPAQAADVATLDCIANEMPAPSRAVFAEVGRRSAVDEKGDAPGLDAAIGDFRKALTLCAGRHHWNDAAIDAAGKYSIAAFVLDGVVKVATQRGVPFAVVEKSLGQLTEAQRVALRDGTADGEAAYEVLVDIMAKNGFTGSGGEQAEMVGAIIGAMLSRDQSKAIFIAS